jgi:bifunctional DNA-binding transcriptional regulator/antitoxin component of YhaV-PrlF toxin-antitoxin module
VSLKHAKLDADGRLLIPSQVRRALGRAKGGKVTMRLDGRGLHIQTQLQSIKRAQELFAELNTQPGVSMPDELIAERREAARRGDRSSPSLG